MFVNINKRTKFYSELIRLLNEPKKIIQIRLFNLTNEYKRTITELVHKRFVERFVCLHFYSQDGEVIVTKILNRTN